METNSAIKFHLAIIAANIIWACNYPAYAILMPKFVSPVAMVTVAVWVAALISLATSSFSKREKVAKEDIWKMIGAAFLVAIVRKMTLMKGLSLTSPIDGSIIDAIDPVLVLIISVVLHRDTFTKRKVAGMALGLAGTVAVILFGANKSTHEASDLLGNLLVFACAVASGFYLVWFKTLVTKYSPVTLLRWIYCIGAVMVLPIGIREVAHTDFSAFSHTAWLLFLYIGIVPTFFPNLLLAWGLRGVHPTVGSIYNYIQPVVAIAISVSLGMDKLNLDTVLFAAVIFIGVGLVISSYSKKKTSDTPYVQNIKH